MHKNFVKPFIIIVALLVSVTLVWFHMQSVAHDQVATTLKPLDTDSPDAFASSQQTQAPTSMIPSAPSSALNVSQQPSSINNQQNNMYAVFHTNKGDIAIEFFKDKAPHTVENFIKLAQSGFYNGVKFHRVIKGFMIQGGDPLTKDDTQQAKWGTGGPGYTFNDEIGPDNKNDAGTIAMANAGPNTNGSQFFINVANNNFLDTKHTVFGKVVQGVDVVKAMEATPTDSNDRPKEPLIINSITLQ